MEKQCLNFFSAVFHLFLFILAGNNDMHGSFDLSLIGPLTAELAALERLKKIHIGLLWGKQCLLFFSAVLDRILFMLAGNDNIHESLDEFDIRPDPTTGFHGNRLGYDGKNCVSTFTWLFFIRSFPYLQVTMTCMRAQTNSNFGLIGPPTVELAALERLKKSP